jgi:hypothetical protein
MCEGCSLEIGTAYRGAVVRQDHIDQPPTWLASVNAAYLGEYLDRDSAMARGRQSNRRPNSLEGMFYQSQVHRKIFPRPSCPSGRKLLSLSLASPQLRKQARKEELI